MHHQVKVTQSCPTLWPHGLYSPWNSPGQNTGVGSLSVLQGIFPTQGSNPGLLHCRRIVYQLSHKGNPKWKWKSLSRVRLFETPWTIQSMEFSRPEYWSGHHKESRSKANWPVEGPLKRQGEGVGRMLRRKRICFRLTAALYLPRVTLWGPL